MVLIRFAALLFLTCLLSATVHAQETAKAVEDCEALLNDVLPVAEGFLTQHGEFYPFGAVMKPDGEIIRMAGNDEREQPLAADIVQTLKAGFAQGAEAGAYKATALVTNVRVVAPFSTQESDAIAISLNHVDDYSVIVVLPYEIKDGKLITGELFTLDGEADIFPSSLRKTRL